MSIEPTGRTDTAADIILCAVNTGALYPRHVSLARSKASIAAWTLHTLLFAIPEYHAATRTITQCDAKTIAEVAQGLCDYYTQHIAEG